MLASVLRFICKILFRVEVYGLENVPKEDGLLIIANHESFLDGLLKSEHLPFLQALKKLNPLMFDFAVKRLIQYNGVSFNQHIFETRRIFDLPTH